VDQVSQIEEIGHYFILDAVWRRSIQAFSTVNRDIGI